MGHSPWALWQGAWIWTTAFCSPSAPPCCAPSNRLLCKWHIKDHGTFEMQIYGRLSQKLCFPNPRIDAQGWSDSGLQEKHWCFLLPFGAEQGACQYLPELVSPGWWICEAPWNFLFFQVPTGVHREDSDIEWKGYIDSSSNYFTFFGSSWEIASAFGKHFKDLCDCTVSGLCFTIIQEAVLAGLSIFWTVRNLSSDIAGGEQGLWLRGKLVMHEGRDSGWTALRCGRIRKVL